MQRRVVEGLEDRQVHVFVVVDIAVSAGADAAGAEAQDRGPAAEPADVAVAVAGHGDGTDMSAASGSAYAYSCFCAVCEQVVRDQDVACGVPAVLGAGLYAAVAVFDGVADEIDILGAVRVDGKAGVVQTMAVGDRVSEDKSAARIIDTGRSISVITREADGDIAGIVEAVAHDIDVTDIGGDGDGFRPAGLAVLDVVAEQQDIGNRAASPAHEKNGIAAVILAPGAGCRDIVDIKVTDYDVMGSGLKKDCAGIAPVSVFDLKSGELYIGTAVEPEHGRTALVLIMTVEKTTSSPGAAAIVM